MATTAPCLKVIESDDRAAFASKKESVCCIWYVVQNVQEIYRIHIWQFVCFYYLQFSDLS